MFSVSLVHDLVYCKRYTPISTLFLFFFLNYTQVDLNVKVRFNVNLSCPPKCERCVGNHYW